MKRKWNNLVAGFCILWGIVCCNPIDGTDPYALWHTYTDSEGLFHFHYLSPPWEKLAIDSSASLRFVVELDGIPLADLGLPGDGMESRLSMVVERHRNRPALAVAWFRLGSWMDNGAEAEPIASFSSDSGIEGLRIRAQASDRFLVSVIHDLPEWGSVSMTVVGKEEVNSPDIQLLLESLEPTPTSVRGLEF